MNRINVLKLFNEEAYHSLDDISSGLDNIPGLHHIDKVNWELTDYKPEVHFKIAYGPNEIYLKYYVSEDYVKAEKTGINQDVYKDSCVEFFVSPADDGIYYNFEFNSIGACLAGSGTGRHNSQRTDPAKLDGLRCLPSLGNKAFSERKGKQEWTLTVAIPTDVFFRHGIGNLQGKMFRANFYKCGDDLTKPHYLTWNPVLSENPDFHRPEYFGLISFD
ncbi:MAG: hypothetical protein KFF49_07030 [Bacteroidales bacterium]|nr:hypothetical protein [Bacteroidales bacterium]